MGEVHKGIYTNTELVNQPYGYPCDALNVVLKKDNIVSNEEGFTSFIKSVKIGDTVLPGYTLPDNTIPIGSKQVDATRVVLFLAHIESGTDEIGILHSNGLYESVLVDNALNFSVNHPVKAQTKIENNQVIVAWVDNYNKPRILNIDDMPFPSGITGGRSLVNSDEITFIDITPDNPGGAISITSLYNSGGRLSSGKYAFFYAYETIDGTVMPYSEPTSYIIVNDDSSIKSYRFYDGCQPGLVTTKSIGISLSLDTIFRYVNIYVIRHVNSVTTIHHVARLSVNSTVTYTYTGYETYVDVPIADYMTLPVQYEKSSVIFKTNNNELGLAGLTGYTDIGYQKYANNIKVNLSKKQVNHYTSSMSGIKDNVLIANNMSFMPGEVYAFYIAFTLKNGMKTYAYHIPGRKKEYVSGISHGGSPVLEDVSISDLLSDYPYMYADNGISPGNVKYFHTRDTAWYSSTQLGYWENKDEKYPDSSIDKNGDWEVWDSSGKIDDIHGQNVRHHKFPTMRGNGTSSSAWYNNSSNTSYLYGIWLSDVYIPSEIEDQIAQIHILRAKRSINNSTVAGCGIMFHNQPTDNIFSTCSFDLMKNGNGALVSHISNEYLFSFKKETDTGTPNEKMSMFNVASLINTVGDDYYIRTIENQHYESDLVAEGSDHYQAARFQGKLVYLDATKTPLLYGWMHPSSLYYAAYLSCFNIYRENVYFSFHEQTLVLMHSEDYIHQITIGSSLNGIFGGDVFPSDYAFRLISKYSPTPSSQGIPKDSKRSLFYHPVIGKYHTGFRYEDDTLPGDDKYYHPKYSDTTLGDDAFAFLKKDITSVVNSYSYDESYTKENDEHHFVPCPLNKKDVTLFKNRVIISEAADGEGDISNWRRFLANNYYDVPGNKGEIVNVDTIGDEIIINTTRALFKTIGAKKMAVSEVDVYIGTGNIFNMPPQEMSISDDGFSGCQSKYACLKVPSGYFYVNQDYGVVFMFSDRLYDISSMHNRNWFMKNLPCVLKRRLLSLAQNINFDFDNPWTTVGVVAEYDKKYDRIIITKKDYDFVDTIQIAGDEGMITIPLVVEYTETESVFTGYTNKLWVLSDSNRNISFIFDAEGATREVMLGDNAFFKDVSWTISFNLSGKIFVSWHSYKPTMMFKNDLDLFMVRYILSDRSPLPVYKANSDGVYGTYFDIDINESYIEYVFNVGVDYAQNVQITNVINKLFEVIEWATEVYNTSRHNEYRKTFTHILIYNENQCSGVIELNSDNLREIAGTWRFNNFRDFTVDYDSKVVSDDKALISTEKVIAANINVNKEWYKRFYFTGKYIAVRLIYDNRDQNEINLYGYECKTRVCWK